MRVLRTVWMSQQQCKRFVNHALYQLKTMGQMEESAMILNSITIMCIVFTKNTQYICIVIEHNEIITGKIVVAGKLLLFISHDFRLLKFKHSKAHVQTSTQWFICSLPYARFDIYHTYHSVVAVIPSKCKILLLLRYTRLTTLCMRFYSFCWLELACVLNKSLHLMCMSRHDINCVFDISKNYYTTPRNPYLYTHVNKLNFAMTKYKVFCRVY